MNNLEVQGSINECQMNGGLVEFKLFANRPQQAQLRYFSFSFQPSDAMGDTDDEDIYLAALESVEKGYTGPSQQFTGKAHVPQDDWNRDQQGT